MFTLGNDIATLVLVTLQRASTVLGRHGHTHLEKLDQQEAEVDTAGQGRLSSDIRIVLLGRDVTARHALRLFLESRMRMSVIECQSMTEYVELQKTIGGASILIVDADTLDNDISTWLARLPRPCQFKGAIVLGTRSETATAAEEAGAEVFVAKEDPPLRLLSAVERLRMRGTDAK